MVSRISIATGLDDWVFQNRTEGGLIVWYMDGAQRIGTETISGGSGTLWRLEAVIDMNSDSHPDFVWQNTVNANLAIWRMNGPTLSQAIAIPDPIAPVWKLENAMDLDHDGHPDLIFKHRTDGRQYVWYMSGITRVGAAPLGSVSSAWSLRHSGD